MTVIKTAQGIVEMRALALAVLVLRSPLWLTAQAVEATVLGEPQVPKRTRSLG